MLAALAALVMLSILAAVRLGELRPDEGMAAEAESGEPGREGGYGIR